jgi:hypothetical protein
MHTSCRNGNLVSYMHLPGHDFCGAGDPWKMMLTPGQWHDVTLYIKLNTPGVYIQYGTQ